MPPSISRPFSPQSDFSRRDAERHDYEWVMRARLMRRRCIIYTDAEGRAYAGDDGHFEHFDFGARDDERTSLPYRRSTL